MAQRHVPHPIYHGYRHSLEPYLCYDATRIYSNQEYIHLRCVLGGGGAHIASDPRYVNPFVGRPVRLIMYLLMTSYDVFRQVYSSTRTQCAFWIQQVATQWSMDWQIRLKFRWITLYSLGFLYMFLGFQADPGASRNPYGLVLSDLEPI